jgi:hypothetical protein
VPSVLIDPLTRLPPDLGGDPDRARYEPVCHRCIIQVNERRLEEGRDLIEVLPGAYDVVEGLPS